MLFRSPTTAIRHSGKLRARQTAELLAATLHLPEPVVADGLEPRADPALWRLRLREMTSDLILVGHLPHLGALAALLLCGEGAGEIIRFRMAGIVALKRENDRWSLHWQLIPEIVPHA